MTIFECEFREYREFVKYLAKLAKFEPFAFKKSTPRKALSSDKLSSLTNVPLPKSELLNELQEEYRQREALLGVRSPGGESHHVFQQLLAVIASLPDDILIEPAYTLYSWAISASALQINLRRLVLPMLGM